MKKIISIMMVLVMVLSMGTMAFAINEEEYYTSSIDYNLDGYYIVSIPSEIHVGERTWVMADDINITEGSTLMIEVANLDPYGYIQLTSADTSDILNVRFRNALDDYATQELPWVGSFTSASTGTSFFFVPEPVDSDYVKAGYYTGSVDFRIVYKGAN